MSPRSRCARCGDDVAWYTTANGKQMPINLLSADNGNIVIEDGVAVVLKKDDERLTDETVPRFLAHFATCGGRGRT